MPGAHGGQSPWNLQMVLSCHVGAAKPTWVLESNKCCCLRSHLPSLLMLFLNELSKFPNSAIRTRHCKEFLSSAAQIDQRYFRSSTYSGKRLTVTRRSPRAREHGETPQKQHLKTNSPAMRIVPFLVNTQPTGPC